MSDMTIAYIGIGSNLGDRESSINKALKMLSETLGIDVSEVSDFIETSPLTGSDQPNFINAVVQIETAMTAKALHKTIADIESSLGRARTRKWEPRIIDLDLLLFGQEVINTEDLIVPHPQMHLRSFVLEGLCQLNDRLLHPILKEPISALAARLAGKDFTANPSVLQLVSSAGVIGVGKTTLAKKLSEQLSGKLLLEPYDENPFMPDVYAGKKELALDSQLYFLTKRATQLNTGILRPGQIAVTDYVFDKELIYARRMLNTYQLALYAEIYPSFASKVAPPVLVIYLTDSVTNCLERIHNRNRLYEQQIEQRFLESLNAGYEQLFADWKTCPVIRISMSDFDCTRDKDMEHLITQVKSYIAL